LNFPPAIRRFNIWSRKPSSRVGNPKLNEKLKRKRYELPHPPGGYDRVLKRVGIQY